MLLANLLMFVTSIVTMSLAKCFKELQPLLPWVSKCFKELRPLLPWVLQNACKSFNKSFNFQSFLNLTCPMGDISNITKDIWQVKKLDFNVVRESRQTQHQKFQHWRQIVILRAGCPEISGHFQNFLDERGVGCPEAYGHTQKLFFGVRRQSALKLLGIPRNVLVRGQAALKLCNVGGIFSQLLSNANPFPTFLWMYVLSGSSKFEGLHTKIVLG